MSYYTVCFYFFEEYNTLRATIYFMYVFTEQKGNKIGVYIRKKYGLYGKI